MYRLFSWIIDINVGLGLGLCFSVVPITLILVIGYCGWLWGLKRRPELLGSPLTHIRKRLFRLIIEFVFWIILLVPIPVTIVEAMVWQNWIEPRQRSQVRVDGDRLVLAITTFHERTGHYPDTLNELVPTEIEYIPVQPDGHPFVYNTDDTHFTLVYKLPSRSWFPVTCTYVSGSSLEVWSCID
jgi:hypothetical protein